jgi:hypothetical protein
MPFTIDSPDLPSNVQALSADLKAQWIEVFNSVLSDCESENGDDCEAAAMTQANGVIKKRQEENMRFLETLKALSEVSDEMVAALGDLRAAIEAINLDEAQSGDVMDKLRIVEQLFSPKDDEEEPEDDEPEMEEESEPEVDAEQLELEIKPETEAVAESFTESVTGAITIAEVDEPKSVRDPLAVKMRLIKAGPGNPADNHYYPGDVLRRDAHVFEGVKMHTTPHDESARGEPTEVAKIRKIDGFEDDGSPVADVIIFDPAFAEKTRNRAKAGELSSLECSILATGVAEKGEIDGKEFNVVESIESAQYVDFVPKAGAGGVAQSIAESAKPEPQKEDDGPQETEPIEEHTVVETERVTAILRETQLPGPSQDRLVAQEYATEDQLSEAIQKEIDYVKSVSGSGQPLGAGQTQPVVQTKTAEQRYQEDAAWYKREREKHGLSPRYS